MTPQEQIDELGKERDLLLAALEAAFEKLDMPKLLELTAAIDKIETQAQQIAEKANA